VHFFEKTNQGVFIFSYWFEVTTGKTRTCGSADFGTGSG